MGGACVSLSLRNLSKNSLFFRARPAAALIHQLVRGDSGLLRGRGSSGSSAGLLGTSVPVSFVSGGRPCFRGTRSPSHPSPGMRSHAGPQLCFSSGGPIRGFLRTQGPAIDPGVGCDSVGLRSVESETAPYVIGLIFGISANSSPWGGSERSSSVLHLLLTRNLSEKPPRAGDGGEGRLCTSSVTPPLSESTRNPPGSKARHG